MQYGKALLLILLLSAAAHALIVGPFIYEQKDLGDPMSSEFLYSMSVDCTEATISLMVMDESYMPVEGASTYLKYIDYSSPVIDSGRTGRDGMIIFDLPGNTSLMRGLFILVVEKKGFRSKEVHFDISGCYSNKSWRLPPPSPPANNNTNGSSVGQNETNATLPQQNFTNSGNATNNTNATGSGEAEPNGTEACGLPVATGLALMFLFLKLNSSNRLRGEI
ncbi:MAG: hypothetical protein QXD77_02980 [Candidatus Aenigmatarchaeota archaeon]